MRASGSHRGMISDPFERFAFSLEVLPNTKKRDVGKYDNGSNFPSFE